MERDEYPNVERSLKTIVTNICFDNTVRYFGL